MELEEMKNTWQDLSKRLEKQESLTQELIESITRQKYKSQLRKIEISEFLGTFICYVGATYILLNLGKIEGIFLLVLAGIAVALLFILPVISLKSTRPFKYRNISSNTYLESINIFGKQRIKFQKLQKLNVALAFLFMLTIFPVLAAIQGTDLAQIPNFWIIIFPAIVVFFAIFSWWVLSSYNKILEETQKMLAEING